MRHLQISELAQGCRLGKVHDLTDPLDSVCPCLSSIFASRHADVDFICSGRIVNIDLNASQVRLSGAVEPMEVKIPGSISRLLNKPTWMLQPLRVEVQPRGRRDVVQPMCTHLGQQAVELRQSHQDTFWFGVRSP
jgi:hypothetical protein